MSRGVSFASPEGKDLAQKIFNRVTTHLLTQKRKAVYCGKCVYRAPDGTSCAIGCLLSPKGYSLVIEARSISNRDNRLALFRSGYPIDVDSWGWSSFLLGLQRIHDQSTPGEWYKDLAEFALNYNLAFLPPAGSGPAPSEPLTPPPNP